MGTQKVTEHLFAILPPRSAIRTHRAVGSTVRFRFVFGLVIFSVFVVVLAHSAPRSPPSASHRFPPRQSFPIGDRVAPWGIL